MLGILNSAHAQFTKLMYTILDRVDICSIKIIFYDMIFERSKCFYLKKFYLSISISLYLSICVCIIYICIFFVYIYIYIYKQRIEIICFVFIFVSIWFYLLLYRTLGQLARNNLFCK